MTLAQLGPALRERTAQKKLRLQVLADERVAYGVVAKVMAVAQNNGANQLSFVTQPSPASGGLKLP
jgi:biopolymer transport protein ExbD